MPTQFSTPGVYVEETPSGARAIAGTETAITAFIGRALRGPVDEPVLLHDFAAFETRFGGLWLDSMLGYAVRDFFDNGGRKALVVRAWRDAPASGTTGSAAHAGLALHGPAGDLALRASLPGAWGNYLQVRVRRIDSDATRAAVATRLGLSDEQAEALFDLTVEDTASGATEEFVNLLVDPATDRFVGDMLAASDLVRTSTVPAQPPANTTTPIGVSISAGDGAELDATVVLGDATQQTGMHALTRADMFNLLCIPPYANQDVEPAVLRAAASFCERQRAMLLWVFA